MMQKARNSVNSIIDFLQGFVEKVREFQVWESSKLVLENKIISLQNKVYELEQALKVRTAPAPDVRGILSYSQAQSVWSGKTAKLYLADMEYELPTFDSVKELIEWDDTDGYQYVTTFYDCDDFAFRFLGKSSIPSWAGTTLGFAWSRTHAFNFFISASKQIYIIEPQNDRIIKIEDAGSSYQNIQLVVM